MSHWNYLKSFHDHEDNYHPRCSYCENLLHILTKRFMIEFKTPKIPPIGANDLNLFNITNIIYSKDFALCENCGAKFDYDIHSNLPLKALANIPPSLILLNNFINNELPKYPLNTTCKMIWKKTFHKRVLIKKSRIVDHMPFYKSITLLLSKSFSFFR